MTITTLSDDVALLDAMQNLLDSGHTYQIGPNDTPVPGAVKLTISGPSGSRSAFGQDLRGTMTALCTQIALARLSR